MKRLACLIVLLAPVAVAQDWMATSYVHTEVSPGIYLLTGADGKMAGGNVGLLVGDEYVVLIDDGFTPTGPALVEKIDELAGRPADFVVNTHVHGDHVGSNATLAENGAIVFAHDNLRRRLVEKPTDAGGPAGIPVVTFADQVTFHVNGHAAHVFHVATAHTDGDSVIHFRDQDVIHAGDLFFNYMFPFIDLDSGGTVDGYIAGQRRIIDLAGDDTRIIPGHGPLADRNDLQVAVDTLETTESASSGSQRLSQSTSNPLVSAPVASRAAADIGDASL